MASKLPYMNAYGVLEKILEKIKKAQTPERFTQDYLSTKLGFSGGSAMASIPLLKKLGFLHQDGTPTDLYHQYRNESNSRQAMASAIKNGYGELFIRNEYANDMNDEDLKGLIVEVTGQNTGSKVVSATVSTFQTLKSFATFNGSFVKNDNSKKVKSEEIAKQPRSVNSLGLSYTINLILPETSNIEVFNAIFKSLRKNILID